MSALNFNGFSCISACQGNIRVFCRVRPLLGEELAGVPGDDPDPQHIVFGHDGKSLELEKLSDVSANEVSCTLFLILFLLKFYQLLIYF